MDDVIYRQQTIMQSHSCEGYSAKVTIEWTIPENVDAKDLPAWRMDKAEDMAGDVLSHAAPRMRAMVQAMRGFVEPALTAPERED